MSFRQTAAGFPPMATKSNCSPSSSVGYNHRHKGTTLMRLLLTIELLAVYFIAGCLAVIRPDLILTMLLVSMGATYLVGWSLDFPAWWRARQARRRWQRALKHLPLVRYAHLMALLECEIDACAEDIFHQMEVH